MLNSIVKGDFLTVLKLRDFFIFTVAQTISQFAEKLYHIILISLVGVYAQGSPSALSRLGITFTLPAIVFSPVVGALTDRWNRKWILIMSDGFRSILVILFLVSIQRRETFSVAYLFVFAVFFFGLFINTSKLSIIPNLVPKDKLLAANSVCLFVIRLATISGMVLGGYLVDWPIWGRLRVEGWEAGLVINAIFFLFSAVLFTRIFFTSESPSSRDVRSFSSDLKAAFRLVLQQKVVLFVMVSAFLLCLIGASIYVLVVSLVQQELGKGTAGVGLMAGALSFGTLLSVVLYSYVGRRFSKAKAISTCLILVGILLIIFSCIKSTPKLVLISFLGGIFLAPIPIAQDTLLHEHLSERMRGRIFGIRDWIINLFFAAGSLILGLISSFMQTSTALVFMGSFIGGATVILLLILIKSECEISSSV